MLARASRSSACACTRAVLALFCLFLAPFETFCRPPTSGAFLPFLRPPPLAVSAPSSALTFASHVVTGSASSGKPFTLEDVDEVDAPAPVHALEDTELRASDADFRVAGPMLEDAAETVAGRELPESEGKPTLGLWLAVLRAFNAGCCGVRRGEAGETSSEGGAGDAGLLFRPREPTLAGGAAWLMRDAAVLGARDLAVLAPSSWSPLSDPVTRSNALLAELTTDSVSVSPAFRRNSSSDESSCSSWRGAIEPVMGETTRSGLRMRVLGL
jgi:hypothetical protein